MCVCVSIGPRSAWTLPPPNNPSWWERWPGERRPNHERARSRSPRRPVPSGHDSTWPHPLPQPPWSFLRKSAMWFRWHLLWCQWPHLSYWNQRQEHQKINRKVQSGKYMSNRINKKDKSIYISSFQYFSEKQFEKIVFWWCFLVASISICRLDKLALLRADTSVVLPRDKELVKQLFAQHAGVLGWVSIYIYIYIYIHIHDDIFILYIYIYIHTSL